MKKFISLILLAAVFCVVPTANAASHKNDIITPQSQLEKRQFQTRNYTDISKADLMKAMLNVLQDDGYIVNNANPLLGFISGSKDFSTDDKTIDISKEFGISKSKLIMKGIKVATIETTANVTEYGKEMRVRINFKRKLLNVYGNAQQIDEIQNEQFYSDFFSKVDKAIFIQKQKI